MGKIAIIEDKVRDGRFTVSATASLKEDGKYSIDASTRFVASDVDSRASSENESVEISTRQWATFPECAHSNKPCRGIDRLLTLDCNVQ